MTESRVLYWYLHSSLRASCFLCCLTSVHASIRVLWQVLYDWAARALVYLSCACAWLGSPGDSLFWPALSKSEISIWTTDRFNTLIIVPWNNYMSIWEIIEVWGTKLLSYPCTYSVVWMDDFGTLDCGSLTREMSIAYVVLNLCTLPKTQVLPGRTAAT